VAAADIAKTTTLPITGRVTDESEERQKSLFKKMGALSVLIIAIMLVITFQRFNKVE